MAEAIESSMSSLKVREENSLDDWDPMADYFSSATNLDCADAVDTFQGIPHIKGSLCPHSDKNGACFKGIRCPHRYHIDKDVVQSNPKMALPEAKVEVTHFNCLPEKRPIAPGTIFMAKVVHTLSPEEFYIVPKHGPVCICQQELASLDDLNMLEKLMGEMQKFYSRYKFRNASSFAVRELVAVKMNFHGKDVVLRGAVTEEVVLDSEDLPDVPCHLFDLGMKITRRMNQVAPLTQFFCSDPPLAYKCYIYGISPVYLRYPKEVCRRFQELVEGKEVLVVCKKTPERRGHDLTDIEPYLVEVRVKEAMDSDKFINVKEELIKTKRVLKWNANIYRPVAWAGLSDAEVSILLNCDCSDNFSGDSDSIDTERQKDSLSRLFSEAEDLAELENLKGEIS